MSPRATGRSRVQEVALQQEQQGHLLDCSGRAVDAGDGGNADSGDQGFAFNLNEFLVFTQEKWITIEGDILSKETPVHEKNAIHRNCMIYLLDTVIYTPTHVFEENETIISKVHIESICHYIIVLVEVAHF